MDVLIHEHVRVQDTRVLQRRSAQFLAIMQEVSIFAEASLVMIASLHDVVGNTGEVEAGPAGSPRGEALASMTANQPTIGFVTAAV